MVVTAAAPPQPGALLGRSIAGYVLDEVIGSGGMGAIYGATSRFVKKRAAVKVMLGEYTANPEVVERFLQEAFVASAVDHPNVVEIWAADRFEEDGRMYILMPLIEGASLESLCESSGPLGLEAAATIAIQIAAGLDAVHKIGVVHRDIKPANILITKRDGLEHFVKIVDFGVARLLTPHLVGLSPGHRTRTNMVLGTAGSMAPEQATGSRDVDARADIYSWGVVMYRMLTGRPPYQGESVWELVERTRTGEPFPRPRALRAEIPPAWEDVIMASLELYPDQRPSSMTEVAARIAKPLPNGDEMLATLARNLRSGKPRAASDTTLAGELEARWSMPSAPTGRRRRALPLLLTAGIAAVAGVIGARLAGSPAGNVPERPGPETSSYVASASPAPDAAVASGPALPSTIDAGTTVAAVVTLPPPAPAPAPASASLASAPAPLARTPAAPVSAPAPAPRVPAPASAPRVPAPAPAPAPIQGSGGSAVPTAAGTRSTGAEVAQTGLIIVRSSPWAKVWIDNESLGQTAVRKSVAPGMHRIRLVGPDEQTKEFHRSVRRGETVTIRWDW